MKQRRTIRFREEENRFGAKKDFHAERPQQTSVSFGLVPLADKTVTIRKAVTVQNLGSTARTYATKVTSSTTYRPGVLLKMLLR